MFFNNYQKNTLKFKRYDKWIDYFFNKKNGYTYTNTPDTSKALTWFAKNVLAPKNALRSWESTILVFFDGFFPAFFFLRSSFAFADSLKATDYIAKKKKKKMT